MSQILSEALGANAKYAASFGNKSKLALPPTRNFTILTCVDARHTDCGMQFFTNEVIRGLLASSLETVEPTSQGFREVGKGPDPARAIPIYGYVYDVKRESC